MKEIEKIKELRKIIPKISLSQAKNLIKQYREIPICIDKFHQKNINTICRLSGCYEEEKVEKYYKICNYNI